jgi:CHASE3 domain sensor protein
MAALLWGLSRAAADRQEFLRVPEIERNVCALGEDLLDAETGKRGYLLTQDDNTLSPTDPRSPDAAVHRCSSRKRAASSARAQRTRPQFASISESRGR